MSEAIGPVSILPAPGQEQIVMPGSADALSEATRNLVESETRRIVDECYVRALEKLRENRERLDRLAAALLEHETLDELDAYRVAGLERAQDAVKGQLPAPVTRSGVEPGRATAVPPAST
jgi:cell division protease FtsH